MQRPDLWERASNLTGSLENFESTLEKGRGRILSPAHPGGDKYLALSDAVVDEVLRAVSKARSHGDAVILTTSEATGLEAIVETLGRPAIFVEHGTFGPAPPKWQVLDGARASIDRVLASVGRIELHDTKSDWPVGTGFVIAPNQVMTNRHVLEHFANCNDGEWLLKSGSRPYIDFLEERSSQDSKEHEIESVTYVSPAVDLAILRIGSLDRKGEPAPKPLSFAKSPKARKGTAVYCVGYPTADGANNNPEVMEVIFQGRYDVKRLLPGRIMSTRPNLTTHERQVTHDCSTLQGSSGSCLVDLKTHQVLGLHRNGKWRVANYAIPLWKFPDEIKVLEGLQ